MATIQPVVIVYFFVAIVLVSCDSDSLILDNNKNEKNSIMKLTGDSILSSYNTSVKDELDSDLIQLTEMTGVELLRNVDDHSVTARMKMSSMFPVMLLPQLIMWGFLPIMLANMKMFVMQALMLNKMALSSAIFMTLRNIVFGPRPGSLVKYANYGYSHGKPHAHRRKGVHHYRS